MQNSYNTILTVSLWNYYILDVFNLDYSPQRSQRTQRYKNIKVLRVISNMKVLSKENLCADRIILTICMYIYSIDEKLMN